VKHRTRLIIKVTATAVVIGAVVLARVLFDDDVANFGLGQAALFLVFGVASIVLFAVVVTDFDRWVETVPPVPKRVVRRSVGRVTKRGRRAAGRGLAVFGAAMTWSSSRVGAALSTVTARSARRLIRIWVWGARTGGLVLAKVAAGVTVFWMFVVRGGARALVLYRTVMHRWWTAVGHAFAWTVVRSGEGLTLVWMWAVRGGVRAVVLYRTVMHRWWTAVGHGFAWTVVRSGEGLTVLWARAVRGGVRTLVRYRAAMQWLWSGAARAASWAAGRVATALSVAWAGVVHGMAWTLGRCGSGLKRAWLAVAGRGDEPQPKPIRRWYTATVDAAFGIPPDGTSVDVFGGRVAPAGRTGRTPETVGAPPPRTPRGADDDAVL
jgi:hypothetical protein